MTSNDDPVLDAADRSAEPDQIKQSSIIGNQ